MINLNTKIFCLKLFGKRVSYKFLRIKIGNNSDVLLLLFFGRLFGKKRSCCKTQYWDNEYPTKISRNLFGKMYRKGVVKGRILTKWLHPFKRKKEFPTVGRKCIFARFFRTLADFYRLGAEIFQIMKKSSVLGHSVTKQAPKQRTSHLSQRRIDKQILFLQGFRQ